MSTLHHESLLETCFDEAWESFRVHNKLTVEQMNEIESHEGVQIALRGVLKEYLRIYAYESF